MFAAFNLSCPSCSSTELVVLHKGQRAGKLQCQPCKWLGTLAQAS